MSVNVVKTGIGDYELGTEIEGVFVAFATLSGARVGQLVQRGESLKAQAAEGNEGAAAQIGEPIAPVLGGGGDEAETGAKHVEDMTHPELDERAATLGVEGFPKSGNKAEKVEAIEAHTSGEGT